MLNWERPFNEIILHSNLAFVRVNMTLWSFPIVCGTNVCVSEWNLESDYESCFALMLSVFQFFPSVDFSRFAKTRHWNIDTDFMNASNFTNVREGLNGTLSSADPELLIFAVYKMILSPVTVIGNGLLIVTGFVDPQRSFRNPSSLFLRFNGNGRSADFCSTRIQRLLRSETIARNRQWRLFVFVTFT